MRLSDVDDMFGGPSPRPVAEVWARRDKERRHREVVRTRAVMACAVVGLLGLVWQLTAVSPVPLLVCVFGGLLVPWLARWNVKL